MNWIPLTQQWPPMDEPVLVCGDSYFAGPEMAVAFWYSWRVGPGPVRKRSWAPAGVSGRDAELEMEPRWWAPLPKAPS